jgi:hypothetical protein
MVTTIEGPVADSRVSFHTTEWQPLVSTHLFAPVAADWFISESADKESDACQDAIARLDIELIRYRLSPDSLTLTAVYNTPLYLSEQERKGILPFLKDHPKVYTWDSYRFR